MILKDGSYYVSKACRECIIENFRFNLANLFVNGKVDQKRVEENALRPSKISSVKITFSEDGSESLPVIPLGLMVYVLINDVPELSSFISAWLYSVEEYLIPVMMQKLFIWCIYHPHIIYDIVKIGRRLFHCKECDRKIEILPTNDPRRIMRIFRQKKKKIKQINN